MYRNIFLKKYFKFFSFGLLFFFLVFSTLGTTTQISLAQDIDANGNPTSPITSPAPGNSITTSITENQRNCQAQGKIYNGNGCVDPEQSTGFSSCIPFPGYFSFTECLGNIANAIFYYIFKFIYYAIVYPLLLIASFVFDFTVYSTVVHFRTNFSELGLGGVGTYLSGGASKGFIYYLWGIVRDFLNIFIFISIIYHAVRSMFEGFEGTKNKFIGLLVFSIVTNFSLLLVKLAIDVSNILTLQAYTLAVKPSGTNSIGAFRTSNGQGPDNYGEFIRNSVDLDRLITNNNAGDLAKLEAENMQNTFMFQLGRLITVLGVIYILLFMTGILLARAISFLYAMILSPLLAADLFFTLLSKNNPFLKEVADGISKVTGKIKYDFYDALIKGPLLVFFIFLIGLFAETIMSAGLIDSMNSAFQGANPSNVPGIIGQNLAVFFKFALFFFMAQKALEFLQGIHLGDKAGTMMNKWGNAVLGRSIGAVAGFGGYAGRRVLGGTFSNSKFRENRMAGFEKMTRSDSAIERSIGQFGIKSLKTLKEGSFDGRNSKTAARLGGLINSATGTTGISVAKVGTPISKSFEALRQEKIDKAAERRNAYIKTAQDGAVVDQEDKNEIRDSTKVELDGEKVTAEQIAAAIKQARNDDGTIKTGVTVNLGTKSLTGPALDIFKKGGAADGALGLANKEIDKKISDKAEENKKAIEKRIREKIAQGKGPTFLKEEVGSADAFAFFNERILGRDIDNAMAEKEQLSVFENAQKKIKEKGRETAAKFSAILETKRDLEDAANQIKSALKFESSLSPDQIETLKEQEKKIGDTLKSELFSKSNNKTSDEDKKKLIEEFTDATPLHNEIAKIKTKTGDTLSSIFDRSNTNSEMEKAKERLASVTRDKKRAEAKLSALRSKGETDSTGRVIKSVSTFTDELEKLSDEVEKFTELQKVLQDGHSKAEKLKEKGEGYTEKITNVFKPTKPAADSKPATTSK